MDLALAAFASKLPREFGALREAGGAERVPLGEQAAGRVGHNLAAVGVVALFDEFLGGSFGREAEALGSDFRPDLMAVVPDIASSSTASSEVAIVGIRKSVGDMWVEVRDAGEGGNDGERARHAAPLRNPLQPPL